MKASSITATAPGSFNRNWASKKQTFTFAKKQVWLLSFPALVLAAGCGNSNREQARAKLAQLGRDYTPQELIGCAMSGKVEVVKLLLDAGMDVGSRATLSQEVKDMDALFAACLEKWEAVVRLLLERGADPNTMAVKDYTPLSYDASLGETGIIALLLASGAKIDAPGPEALNPLMLAAANGEEAAAKLLIQKGAAVDAAAPVGLTPLMQATTYNHTGIMKALLDAGADVDKTNKDGRAALMHATFRGNTEATDLLLKHHAKVGIIARDGKTSVDYAKVAVDRLKGASAATN